MQTTIFKANLQSITEKLEKLARKAVKLGLTPVSYSSQETDPITLHIDMPNGQICWNAPCLPDNGMGHHRSYARVIITLNGEAPVINGWKLVARLEHFGSTNLVHIAPGNEDQDLSAYRDRQVCDHCNVNNNRKETYLICNGEETKQIGRNCLADYLRSPEYAQQLVAMGAYLKSIGNCLADDNQDDDRPRYGAPEFLTTQVVELSAACTRQFGYVKKSDETKYPTTMRLDDHFAPVNSVKIEVSQEDKDIAARAIDWISTQEETSDYIRNLKILAKCKTVSSKHWGYLASLPVAYLRTLAVADKGTSEHIGTEGSKITLLVEITDIRAIEGEFGTTHLVKMKQGDNILTWFASNLPRCEQIVKGKIVAPINAGDIVTVTGKIKRHTDYKGQKQTQLSHCKITRPD